jgi:hypothetical protein
MQERLSREEKTNLLITRATRLNVFAEKLGVGGRYLIEGEAYLILEVFEPRPRAIWRYISFALKRWRRSLWFSVRFGTLVWWHRRVKGIDHGKAIDLACATIEEKAFPQAKGGA